VVISNDGPYEETWKQVYAAWQETFPDESKTQRSFKASKSDLVVQRARLGEAEQIADLINRLDSAKSRLDYEQVMEAFGDKAFLLLRKSGRLCGIIGWQVENLVMKIDDVYLDENLSAENALSLLLKEAEDASQELQCEISLLFLPMKYQGHEELFRSLGYSSRPIQSLGVRVWEEEARESLSGESFVLYKQLRKDRVLKPV
jgi:N-acetylglutamate synthase-like GNAT family acetyltransferase